MLELLNLSVYQGPSDWKGAWETLENSAAEHDLWKIEVICELE